MLPRLAPPRAARACHEKKAGADEIDRRDTPAVAFEPHMRRAAAGARGRNIVAHRIGELRRRGAVRYYGGRRISGPENHALLVKIFGPRERPGIVPGEAPHGNRVFEALLGDGATDRLALVVIR